MICFFQGTIQFGGEIEDKAIIRMAENKEIGNEFSYCTYEEDDEDYKEGFVAVLFFEPFVEEDKVIHIENKKFYDELINFISKYSSDSKKISCLEKYLLQIKTDLKLIQE